MANLLSALFAWLAGPARARAGAAGADAALDPPAQSGAGAAEIGVDDTVGTSTGASTVPADDALASAAAVPGWFGKMPPLGDFASRRLPDTFVGAWDAWLSESLEAASTTLDARWDDVYRAAPPWRFLLSPGVIDAHAWIGVIVASRDRVGRQFPLTIAAAFGGVPHSLASIEAWWEGAVQAAAAVQGDGATVETFDEALAQVGAPPCETTVERGAVVARVPTSDGLDAAFAQAVPLLVQACRGTSFWWVRGEEGKAPLVVVRGLPKPAAFARLLDGTL